MITLSVIATGADRIVGKLQHQKYRAKTFAKSVIVGYKARYAIYVHEDMQRAPKTGQRLYLIQAEIQTRERYTHYMKSGLMVVGHDKPFPMVEILLGCCDIIMGVSQTMVPVDTGFLKNSKFQRED